MLNEKLVIASVFPFPLWRTFPLERAWPYAEESCEVFGTKACGSTLLQSLNIPAIASQLFNSSLDVPDYLLFDARKNEDGSWINYEVKLYPTMMTFQPIQINA